MSIILLILLGIDAIFLFFYLIIQLCCLVKCFKNKRIFKKCNNRRCRLNEFCFRFEDKLTETDIEKLKQILDDWK